MNEDVAAVGCTACGETCGALHSSVRSHCSYSKVDPVTLKDTLACILVLFHFLFFGGGIFFAVPDAGMPGSPLVILFLGKFNPHFPAAVVISGFVLNWTVVLYGIKGQWRGVIHLACHIVFFLSFLI